MTAPGFIGRAAWTLERRGGLIIAGEREYQGSRFFEVRLWADGGTVPTRQGVTLPPGEVANLGRALVAYGAGLAAESASG